MEGLERLAAIGVDGFQPDLAQEAESRHAPLALRIRRVE
jgi:hypothetical protein